MTSIEWLESELSRIGLNHHVIGDKFKQAKEMHKNEIIDAYIQGDYDVYDGKSFYNLNNTADKYYKETFGSKGSDGHELNDDIPPTSQYFPTSSQTEISDEEIEKAAEKNYSYDELRDGEFMGIIISAKIDAWVDAIRWYREQLKQKTNG